VKSLSYKKPGLFTQTVVLAALTILPLFYFYDSAIPLEHILTLQSLYDSGYLIKITFLIAYSAMVLVKHARPIPLFFIFSGSILLAIAGGLFGSNYDIPANSLNNLTPQIKAKTNGLLYYISLIEATYLCIFAGYMIRKHKIAGFENETESQKT